jgi:hemoglobin
MATEGASSLYERLGGVYSIATVIDDFIDRIMVDPRLNANPRVDEAHHRVPPAGFKYLVTEMVCWATGGPQKYTGRSMKDSHQNLMITAAEWEAFLDPGRAGGDQSYRCQHTSRYLSFKRGWEKRPLPKGLRNL